MANIYKISSEMSEAHKRAIAELKNSYEEALKNHKKDEQKAINRVSEANKNAVEAESDLKKIHEEIGAKVKEFDTISKDIADANNILNSIKTSISGEEQRMKNSDDEIKRRKEEFEKEVQATISKFAQEEERIKILANEVIGAQEKNNKTLAEVIEKTTEVKAVDENNSKVRSELEATCAKLLADRNALNGEKNAVTAQKQENSRIGAQLDSMRKNFEQRDEALKIRETHIKAIETEQKDKKISLDYREMEISRLEDKVNKLIEMNKVKV
jgi:chromosome segregation ATPase